jgi:hypothetical protein
MRMNYNKPVVEMTIFKVLIVMYVLSTILSEIRDCERTTEKVRLDLNS